MSTVTYQSPQHACSGSMTTILTYSRFACYSSPPSYQITSSQSSRILLHRVIWYQSHYCASQCIAYDYPLDVTWLVGNGPLLIKTSIYWPQWSIMFALHLQLTLLYRPLDMILLEGSCVGISVILERAPCFCFWRVAIWSSFLFNLMINVSDNWRRCSFARHHRQEYNAPHVTRSKCRATVSGLKLHVCMYTSQLKAALQTRHTIPPKARNFIRNHRREHFTRIW